MRCIPKQKRAVLINILVALFVASGVALFAASIVLRASGREASSVWLRLAGSLLIIAGVYVLARYRLLKFAYVIRPREEWDDTGLVATYASLSNVPYYMLDFAVYKTAWMREPVAQCVLSLEDFREWAPASERKTFKNDFIDKYGAGFLTCDYRVTPWSRDSILLVFKFEDKHEKFVGILIEPDEEMRAFFETIG